MQILGHFCEYNKNKINFQLISGKDFLKSRINNSLRGTNLPEKVEVGRKVKLPFMVLELKNEPVVNQSKNGCLIDLKKRWKFMELFDHLCVK